VALALPSVELDLLDGREQRAEFLLGAVTALDLAGRVGVISCRAEEAARGGRRGRYAAVLARGFGPPAVTAECGVGFLRPGGVLVVSEPPGGDGAVNDQARWPEEGVAQLGLRMAGRITTPRSLVLLEASATCPERFPRRVGIPAKRPLF